MPEMTVRSSTRGLPGLPRGRCGLSAFHASSDNQNKLLAMTIASCDSNQAQIYNQNQQTVWVPYLVFVGNAGGDFKGGKGHMYALDAKTGKIVWQFFLVPKSEGDTVRGPE